MTIEDSIKDLTKLEGPIKDLIRVVESSGENPHLEALDHLQKFIALFNTLVERKLRVRLFVRHRLESLSPDDPQNKFVYQVIVEKFAGVGSRNMETPLLNCHFFPDKYQVAITLSGGSFPQFCHSKEEFFKKLLQHLSANESIWKLQEVMKGI